MQPFYIHEVADLLIAAETEAAAYYAATLQQYGADIATWAIDDWLCGLDVMDWPPRPGDPCVWRRLTIQSASRLANLLLEQRPC